MKRRTVKKYYGGEGEELLFLLAVACIIATGGACGVLIILLILLKVCMESGCTIPVPSFSSGSGENAPPILTNIGQGPGAGAGVTRSAATAAVAGSKAEAFFDSAVVEKELPIAEQVGGKQRKTRARRNRSRSHRK